MEIGYKFDTMNDPVEKIKVEKHKVSELLSHKLTHAFFPNPGIEAMLDYTL
jgi:hypothetical protein